MRNTAPIAALPDSASHGSRRCSVLGALTVVGDFWTLGVIRSVFNGFTRFGEIQRELGVATNVLTDRLNRLVELDVLERAPYGSAGTRHRYVLTPPGRELGPVLLALKAWGDRHVQGGQPWTRWRHGGCTSAVEVGVRCPDCDASLGVGDIELVALR